MVFILTALFSCKNDKNQGVDDSQKIVINISKEKYDFDSVNDLLDTVQRQTINYFWDGA